LTTPSEFFVVFDVDVSFDVDLVVQAVGETKG
jgi:hypothetical protein